MKKAHNVYITHVSDRHHCVVSKKHTSGVTINIVAPDHSYYTSK